MDTTDPQQHTQTQPQPNQPQPQQQPTQQQSQHHHHHHPHQHRAPPAHAQPQQPHPQHIQQQSQVPIHQQTTQHQHAQPAAYQMPYAYTQQYPPPRHAYAQAPFSNISFNPNTIPYAYTPAQYQAWATTGYQPAPAATPSSQNIPTTPHVTTTLVKRERRVASIKDPDTKKEVDLDDDKPSAKSSASKVPSTQSSASETKTNPIATANTNTATNSVTLSSSNDRANTSSPPSISNILLRKVSEDTESDKRQVSATTITTKPTTTTITSKATVPPSTTKASTTTTPTPIPAPTAIKPAEEVVTKVNNINGNHKSVDDSKQDSSKEDEKAVKEKSVDGEKPVVETSVGSNDAEETKEEANEKVTLHYEDWQYNPFKNRIGKKKYDKQFLIDVCEKICKLSVFDEDKRDDSMDNYSFPQVDMFAPSFSRNIPHLANNRQNDASRRPNHQNYMGRSSAGQERVRRIIAPSSSLTQEVELKTVANPWRPGKEVKEEEPDVAEVESLKKKFRSILNKLTPNNFDNLAKSVTDLEINTETKLGEMIDIVFAKALAEPGYCVLYGQMCSHLKKITAGKTNFNNSLLKRCQNQFQSDIYSGLNLDERKQKIDEETDPDVKKHMNEELYEEMYRCRMRGLGLIKFIGELYKIEMLNDAIMFDCMIRLLNDTSEESLECLCDLLVTIGEKLDRSSQKRVKEEKKAQKGPSKSIPYQSGKSMASVVASGNAQQQQPNAVPDAITTLDDIFDRLHKIRKNKDIPVSMRIRFKLLDVCELREKENWQSKKAKDNPKKIEEIREAHLEKLENEKNRLNQAMGPRRSQEGRRHLDHPSNSSSQISALANESGGNRGGASNMHGSASSHAIRDHSLDDKMKQNHSDPYETSKQHQQSAKAFLALMSKNSANSSDSKSLRPTTALRPAASSSMSLRPATNLLSSRSSNAGASDNNAQ